MTEQEFKDAAERYIDAAGLDNAIGALAEIAREKAEHIQVNWQDRSLAALWGMAANAIDRAESHAHVRAVSGRG